LTKPIELLKTIINRLYADFRKYWWVLLILLGYLSLMQVIAVTSCPLYQTLGLPCAGCGMTRAMRFVLTGQFARAYFLNPLAFVIVFYGLYSAFFRYIKGKPVPYFWRGIIAIIIMMLLFYAVRMYMYFPNRVPYVYNYNNTMENFIPGYRDFVRQLFGF